MEPLLVEVRRNGTLEAVHRVHAVAVRDGAVIQEAGDAGLVCFMRSSSKPIQALPLVRARDDLSQADIAKFQADIASGKSKADIKTKKRGRAIIEGGRGTAARTLAVLGAMLQFAVGRRRPDGSNNQSFPSGHSAVTFAIATVIERHLGWKKSILGYAIASYVATSRLHDNVHYLSDVVFGAAVGSIAGRTVVHHEADYWAMTPVMLPGGGVAVYVSKVQSEK